RNGTAIRRKDDNAHPWRWRRHHRDRGSSLPNPVTNRSIGTRPTEPPGRRSSIRHRAARVDARFEIAAEAPPSWPAEAFQSRIQLLDRLRLSAQGRHHLIGKAPMAPCLSVAPRIANHQPHFAHGRASGKSRSKRNTAKPSGKKRREKQ